MITHSKVGWTNVTLKTIFKGHLFYHFHFSFLLSDCNLSSGGNMCISLERKSSTRIAPLWGGSQRHIFDVHSGLCLTMLPMFEILPFLTPYTIFCLSVVSWSNICGSLRNGSLSLWLLWSIRRCRCGSTRLLCASPLPSCSGVSTLNFLCLSSATWFVWNWSFIQIQGPLWSCQCNSKARDQGSRD